MRKIKEKRKNGFKKSWGKENKGRSCLCRRRRGGTSGLSGRINGKTDRKSPGGIRKKSKGVRNFGYCGYQTVQRRK